MTGTTWTALRDLLTHRYDDFRRRLIRQFGSEDIASETLHETWLRLDRPGDAGQVRSPPAFLLRIAANIAKDRQRGERRRTKRIELDDALDVVDPSPDPARTVEARLDLKKVEAAIAELPKRTQTILMASRLRGMTHQAIADELGISKRTVLYELKQAVVLLDARLENISDSDCTHGD